MRIVTAPTRHTLGTLGLNPESGLGGAVSDAKRRSTMLAWHLNRWLLARAGGTGDRPWLGNLSSLSSIALVEFGERLQRYDRALEAAGAAGADAFGWEFLLASGVWKPSRNVSGIYVLHAGFKDECGRLAGETRLPLRLADPLLRSWLRLLFRSSTPECPVILLSVPGDELEPPAPDTLLSREFQAEPLAECEMNAADPLPRGAWRLVAGRWEVAATAEDLEVAGALQRVGRPSPDDDDNPAFLPGRDRGQRRTQLPARAFRDARTIEARGLERLKIERAANQGDPEGSWRRKTGGFGGGRPSIQLGRYFSYYLKRIFSRKRSS